MLSHLVYSHFHLMRGAFQRFIRFAAEPAGHVPFGMNQSHKICDIAILFRLKKPLESILNGGTKGRKGKKKKGRFMSQNGGVQLTGKVESGDRTGGRAKRFTDGVAPAMQTIVRTEPVEGPPV